MADPKLAEQIVRMEKELPSRTFTKRKRAAQLRAEAAVDHVQKAIDQLNAGARDLCSIIGALALSKEFTAAVLALKDLRWKAMTLAAEEPNLFLDHEPKTKSSHGCGGV